MANRETPETIARTRMVSAEAVLNNTADLRGYPYRYLAVGAFYGIGPERVTNALAAAEALDRWGWDLVHVAELTSSNLVYAFLRRRLAT
jgi:hypothetical protein